MRILTMSLIVVGVLAHVGIASADRDRRHDRRDRWEHRNNNNNRWRPERRVIVAPVRHVSRPRVVVRPRVIVRPAPRVVIVRPTPPPPPVYVVQPYPAVQPQPYPYPYPSAPPSYTPAPPAHDCHDGHDHSYNDGYNGDYDGDGYYDYSSQASPSGT